MKIRTFLGGAVAAMTIGLSGAALAEDGACATEADEIITYKTPWLLCAKNGGKWTYSPIWQFQGKKGDGCEVHAKLAKQLYVEHDEPPKERGNPDNKGFREAQGAANALLDHKYEDAILHLRNFRETIANNAKLNTDPAAQYPDKKNGSGTQYTAAELADWWMAWAAAMELRIYDPDTGTGCSVP